MYFVQEKKCYEIPARSFQFGWHFVGSKVFLIIIIIITYTTILVKYQAVFLKK